MLRRVTWASVFALPLLLSVAYQTQAKTMAQVLAAAQPSDWRDLDPANTLYMELESGRVIIEMAPQFAPQLVANLKTLVQEKYFDGLAIMRVQDNYVVQWGDPQESRSLGSARKTVPAEFERAVNGLKPTALADRDGYAAQTGFVGGFPVGWDPKANRAWLVHCYAMVGAGRDTALDSGNGSQLYAVIGHAPRHLDRNITLIGRVVAGMELLSPLPRGKGEMGFYGKDDKHPAIRSVRLASDVPENERTPVQVLRTDTETFRDLVESRRNRREPWFKRAAGYIDVCNVPWPTRLKKE